MKKNKGTFDKGAIVHNWQPPCSCGVKLNEALNAQMPLRKIEAGRVHNWQPPCSCGISLDDVLE